MGGRGFYPSSQISLTQILSLSTMVFRLYRDPSWFRLINMVERCDNWDEVALNSLELIGFVSGWLDVLSTSSSARLFTVTLTWESWESLMSDCFLCSPLIASVSIDNNYNVSLIILIFSDAVILWYDGVGFCVAVCDVLSTFHSTDFHLIHWDTMSCDENLNLWLVEEYSKKNVFHHVDFISIQYSQFWIFKTSSLHDNAFSLLSTNVCQET